MGAGHHRSQDYSDMIGADVLRDTSPLIAAILVEDAT
jgi:hypothetical protein